MRTSTAVFITIAVLTTAGPGWAQSGQVQAKEIPASNPVRSRIHQKSPEPPHTTTDFASNEHLEMEAQLAGFASMRRISFQDFMAPIEESNLDFATQRDSVAIARAQSSASRVYEDPTFQAGYGGDVSHNRQATIYSGGISQTILLGGRIAARSSVANSGLNVSIAQTIDFLRNLRGQAAGAFVDQIVVEMRAEQKLRGHIGDHAMVVG